jgi:hypothetical protein
MGHKHGVRETSGRHCAAIVGQTVSDEDVRRLLNL